MRAEFFNNFDQNSVHKAAGTTYYFYMKIFVINIYWKYNTGKEKLNVASSVFLSCPTDSFLSSPVGNFADESRILQ